MSDELERLPQKDKAVVPHEKRFEEAPGETEADAVRDAFLKSAGPDPAQMASALSGADGGLRSTAVSRLQQERGNSYVQRVVTEARGAPGRMVGMSQPEMVDEVVQRKGSGAPIAEPARGQLESHFGADLGDVRVHTDGQATALNRELDAQAFTVGKDVFFAEGKYNPTSSEGQGLLAHEVTHVGQQTGFGAAVQRQAEPEAEEEEKAAQAAPAPTPEPKKEEEEKA